MVRNSIFVIGELPPLLSLPLIRKLETGLRLNRGLVTHQYSQA